MVPLPLLFAFLWGQGAVGFGLAAYFFTMHIPIPEMQHSPIWQERLRAYPAWRLKVIRVLPLTASLVMLLGTVVCLVFVGLNAYAATRPRARLALPADFATALVWGIEILAFQAFIVAAYFLQFWRSRRVVRQTAREAIQRRKAAEEGAGRPAASSNQ